MEVIYIKEREIHKNDELLKELFEVSQRMNEILDEIEERGCVYEYVRKSD